MNMIKTYETETSFALKYDNVLAHGSNVRKKKKKERHFIFGWSQAEAEKSKKINPENNECRIHRLD